MLGHVCNPHCALCSQISANILCAFACNRMLDLGGYAPKLPLENEASQEVVSSWANLKPGVLHEQPKKDWILQGWIFESECFRVTLGRRRPWVLEIYSHHSERRVFLACSYLWGNSKFAWWKILHCWKIYASEMGTSIFSYCCSPYLISSTPFLPEHRKILLKFIFCSSFHFTMMVFFLSLVGPWVWRVKAGH